MLLLCASVKFQSTNIISISYRHQSYHTPLQLTKHRNENVCNQFFKNLDHLHQWFLLYINIMVVSVVCDVQHVVCFYGVLMR